MPECPRPPTIPFEGRTQRGVPTGPRPPSVPPRGGGQSWRPPAPTSVTHPWEEHRGGGQEAGPPPLSLPRGRRTELEATGHHLCPSLLKEGQNWSPQAPSSVPTTPPPPWEKDRAGSHRPPPLSLPHGRTELEAPGPHLCPSPHGIRTELEATGPHLCPSLLKDRIGVHQPPAMSLPLTPTPPWEKDRAGRNRLHLCPSPMGEGQS